MFGTEAKTAFQTSIIYAGGEGTEFPREDIVRFGKVHNYGDFVVRYIVELSDGRRVFIFANQQTEEDRKWIRKLAGKCPWTGGRGPSRDVPQHLDWISVTPHICCGCGGLCDSKEPCPMSYNCRCRSR